MNTTFCDLPDDVLIHTIAFLSVPDILLLRQTCKRFHVLTRLRIIWTNAFKLDIVSNDYPFPIDDADLEHRTRHAYRLASRWLADSPLTPKSETSFTGSPVSEIKFIPGRQHRWVLTVFKEIRSVLTIWDVSRQLKCSEWSPKGAIFTGVKLNADPGSEAAVVVSLSQRIVLLGLDDNGSLHEIRSVEADLRPVSMTGDVIALSYKSKTMIYNWRTDERAYLDDAGDAQRDRCLQVVFTPTTILVVRACSIALYDSAFTRIATHSFSWVDGASATPTSILIRSGSSNLWASDLNSLKLYSLSSFPPPTLVSEISSRCGTFRCADAILGKRATAVWIRPRDPSMVSHWWEDHWGETLIATVFPGPLNATAQVRMREVCMNSLNTWTALDYDEDLGRIALGSGYGKVTIVQL